VAAKLQYLLGFLREGGSGMRLVSVVVAVGVVTASVIAIAAASTGDATPQRLDAKIITAGNGKIALVDPASSWLISVNPDGSGRRLLARCGRSFTACVIRAFVWSPNGRRLLFFRASGLRTYSSYSLYVVEADGHNVRRLVSCGHCGLIVGSRAAWSPNGSSIAFSATNGLFVVDVNGGLARRLTRGLDFDPAWSPNGSKIVFSRGDSLYAVNPDGSALTKLTSVGRHAADPAWSPDGKQLTFDGPDQIYVVDADGSHQRLLLDGSRGSGPGTPSWSPDGTRILFFNTPGTPGAFTAEVWVMKPDGTDQRRLYHSGCCVGSWFPPIWSPNGKSIAISADSAGGVLVMNSDGTDGRTLSRRPSDIAWQPIR